MDLGKLNSKTILFIPSNENHCRIFQSISTYLKEYNQIFLTQGSYKNEGTEDTLKKLGINFTKIDDYENKDAEFILKKENVNIVVIGNDSDVIPQWFVNSGKKIGIPSVLIQDGMMIEIKTLGRNLVKSTRDKLLQSSPKLKLLAIKLRRKKQYKKTSYGLGGCTQIHAWGRQSESYYIDKGVDRKTIVIIGIPKTYDATIAKPKNQKKIILYTPSDLVHMNIVKPEYAKELTDNVCAVVKSMKNVQLIVKPHPREDKNLYNDLPTKFDSIIRISDEDIVNLIQISSVIVNDLSTVGLEAIFFKKPVIIYLPNVELFTSVDAFPNDLIAQNVVLYAKDKQSLLEQITKILEGKWKLQEERLDIIEKYLGFHDNKSSFRSAQSISNLLEMQ